jgi:hypothetical protein
VEGDRVGARGVIAGVLGVHQRPIGSRTGQRAVAVGQFGRVALGGAVRVEDLHVDVHAGAGGRGERGDPVAVQSPTRTSPLS